jgi:hypothetical protein
MVSAVVRIYRRRVYTSEQNQNLLEVAIEALDEKATPSAYKFIYDRWQARMTMTESVCWVESLDDPKRSDREREAIENDVRFICWEK